MLADGLASSVTPVRDALHLLTGEGLVTSGSGEGFHVPTLDEPALADLYRWNLEVLLVAMRGWPREDRAVSRVIERHTGNAVAMSALCSMIGERSGNAEHAAAIGRNNARLSPVRAVEGEVIPEIQDELSVLRSDLFDIRVDDLRRHLAAYHRVRERRAAAIVRAHYRIPGGSVAH